MTLQPHTLVDVTLSERPQVLTMPWSEAVEKYIRVAGGNESEVHAQLQASGEWSTSVEGLVLAIRLPTRSAA